MKKKNTFVAVVLNFFPGTGFFYVDKAGLGILFIIIGLVSLIFMLTGIGAFIGLPMYIIAMIVSCGMCVSAALKHNKGLSVQVK